MVVSVERHCRGCQIHPRRNSAYTIRKAQRVLRTIFASSFEIANTDLEWHSALVANFPLNSSFRKSSVHWLVTLLAGWSSLPLCSTRKTSYQLMDFWMGMLPCWGTGHSPLLWADHVTYTSKFVAHRISLHSSRIVWASNQLKTLSNCSGLCSITNTRASTWVSTHPCSQLPRLARHPHLFCHWLPGFSW